jgi:hypothetical protein
MAPKFVEFDLMTRGMHSSHEEHVAGKRRMKLH